MGTGEDSYGASLGRIRGAVKSCLSVQGQLSISLCEEGSLLTGGTFSWWKASQWEEKGGWDSGSGLVPRAVERRLVGCFHR